LTSHNPHGAPPAPADPSRHSAEPSLALRQGLQAGDPDALDALAVAFFDDAARFCRALLRDEETAMEAAQEAFLRLLERHRLYDAGRPFRPWFFKICRNCCLEARRQRATASARVVEMDPADDEVAALAGKELSPFESLLRSERESEALRLLGELAEEKRAIVLLHLFDELTFRDIAEVTGRPANSVASVYYRALEDLRKIADSPSFGFGPKGGRRTERHAS